MAFMWNMAGSHTQGDTEVTPRVQMTVEQAADQAWASAAPAIATGGSPQTAGQQVVAHPHASGSRGWVRAG